MPSIIVYSVWIYMSICIKIVHDKTSISEVKIIFFYMYNVHAHVIITCNWYIYYIFAIDGSGFLVKNEC